MSVKKFEGRLFRPDSPVQTPKQTNISSNLTSDVPNSRAIALLAVHPDQYIQISDPRIHT
jgi:hypothetical protein